MEKPSARTAAIQSLSLPDVRSLMLSMPFERFRQRDLLDLEGSSLISLPTPIWQNVDMSSFVRCIRLCWQRLGSYYRDLE